MVGCSNMYFYEKLNFNPFMYNFVRFTIVIFDLELFHVMLYNITYIHFCSGFHALITCCSCIITSLIKSPKQVLALLHYGHIKGLA